MPSWLDGSWRSPESSVPNSIHGSEFRIGPTTMTFENIVTERRERVGLVTLSRPKQLNALNDALMNDLGEALREFDKDETIGAIVITGGDKANAARRSEITNGWPANPIDRKRRWRCSPDHRRQKLPASTAAMKVRN
jgi:hypothetical protein